jgi:hypothetical protein
MLSRAFTAVLAAISAFFLVSLATALVVGNNPGGLVVQFLAQEQQLEARGEGVQVVGRCASACTVVLHNPNVCVAPGGSFMFHKAFLARPTPQGLLRGPDDEQTTAVLWSMYPPGVQAWINAHGGLQDQPLNMSAQAAWSVGVARCR